MPSGEGLYKGEPTVGEHAVPLPRTGVRCIDVFNKWIAMRLNDSLLGETMRNIRSKGRLLFGLIFVCKRGT